MYRFPTTLWTLIITSWTSGVCSQHVGMGVASDQVRNLGRSDVPEKAICIRQENFDKGTYIITTPGQYKLCEDISFNPNAPEPGQMPKDDAFDPIFSEEFDENSFGLGFYAAIAIATNDVDLYLNGYTIEQSAGHALMQRFFAIIELANSPFLPKIGPADFVGDNAYTPATNVGIHGPGVIGRSSHHGIHGNDNSNVSIEGVTFKDFEVAAISLNNVDNLVIQGNTVENNRHDVPVLGLFSAARLIRPYIKALKEQKYEMNIKGEKVSAAQLYDDLITSINNVYNDVINGNGFISEKDHPEEYALFHNPFKVVDGPCYAFLVHGKGPAVLGQGYDISENSAVTSSNIVIENNIIKNIQCWSNEVPADTVTVNPGVSSQTNDVRGAVLQFISTYDKANPSRAMNVADGTYKGNAVSNVQMMVANAIHEGDCPEFNNMQTLANSISPKQVAWAQGTASYDPQFRCNGDSMHHVIKGIVVIRVEDTEGFRIVDNIIDDVTSHSVEPYNGCDTIHPANSEENQSEQQAGNIRGISVAAVRGYSDGGQSKIEDNRITNFDSENANIIIGIDIQGDSADVKIDKNYVNLDKKSGVDDTSDNIYALRVRKHTDQDSIAIEDDNILKQDTLIETMRRLRASQSKKKLPAGHVNIYGGDFVNCPFTNNNNKN